MARVFISYKRADKDKVFKIKDQIEAALGEKCWIDLDGIESDAQFKSIIIQAINACEIVLFMYSKAHTKIVDFEKDWTVRELNFANAKSKRVVFVNVDGSPLTDAFEFDYGTKQQIDGNSTEAINRLIGDLGNWLKTDINPVPPIANPEKAASRPKRPSSHKTPYFVKDVNIAMIVQLLGLTILIIIFCWMYATSTFSRTHLLRLQDQYLILDLLLMVVCTVFIKKYSWSKWTFLLLDLVAIVLLYSISSRYHNVALDYKIRWGNMSIYHQALFTIGGIRPAPAILHGTFLYLIHNLCIHVIMNSRILWQKVKGKR